MHSKKSLFLSSASNIWKREYLLNKTNANFSDLSRPFKTHEVTNQSSPLVNFNLFRCLFSVFPIIIVILTYILYRSDPALRRSLNAFSVSKSDIEMLDRFGALSGSQHLIDAAEAAEKNVPILNQFDNYGRRVDKVAYHPSYHSLMKHGYEAGACSYGYKNSQRNKGESTESNVNASTKSHITRAALIYMENQIEPGHCCPLVMTAAAVPVLRKVKNSYCQEVVKKLLSDKYDPCDSPISDKYGATAGLCISNS
jgi:putative acyl-CoA dehydrogenase